MRLAIHFILDEKNRLNEEKEIVRCNADYFLYVHTDV